MWNINMIIFFNVDVPQFCPEVPSEIMNPADTWKNKEEYEIYAKKIG